MATSPSTSAQLLALSGGEPLWLGLIVAGAATVVDNATTAVPFTIAGGSRVWLQGDAAFYVEAIAAASMGAAGIHGVKVEANQLFPVGLQAVSTKVSVLGVAGAVNVKVFQLKA